MANEGWKQCHSQKPNQSEKNRSEKLFSAKLPNVLNMKWPSPLLFFYNSQFGKTISPVSFALFVEVVNSQQKVTRIADYKIEALLEYDEGGELHADKQPNGGIKLTYKPAGNSVKKWRKLHSMGFLHDQVYWVNNDDFSKCKQIDFSQESFDALARDKQLVPGQSIMGWIFLEVDHDLRGQVPVIHEFKVTLVSSAGQEEELRLRPASGGDDHFSVISGGVWHLLEGYTDLSGEELVMCPMVDARAIIKEGRYQKVKVDKSD